MRLREFVAENRENLTRLIVDNYGENCRPTNDDERADWVMNDEGLYQWAQNEGVPI